MGTEAFGNKPVANNEEWAAGVLAVANDPHRTYTRWVNGNEDFCFCGDADAVNAALVKFAAVAAPVRQVTLLPGRGLTKSFEKKDVPYDWRLHAPSGIYLGMLKLQGDAVGGHAALEVRIHDDLKAADLRVPAGLELVRPRDLADRNLERLRDGDPHVAGRAAIELGRLAWVAGVVEVLAEKLGSDSAYVRQCVALALARAGADALPALAALERCRDRAAGNERAYLEDRLKELRAAVVPKPAAVETRADQLRAIDELCEKYGKR